jgi:predicted AlkP superfamily phosphohydrolase/phosphomutase
MHRLIIFGVDGGTLEIVRPLIARGMLPNFARVMEQGTAGELGSTFPPMTFPAFTTFMTGKNPGGHGVFDFFERIPGRYGVRFVNANSRRSRTLWRMLSEGGRRVSVIGFPVTYPPESINGYMISGFDAPGIGARADRTCFHPPDFYEELRREVGDYIITPSVDMLRALEHPEEGVNAILETIERKVQAALYTQARERWDCFAFMLIESDFSGHRYWRFYDPNSPHYRDDYPPALREAFPRIYGAIDAALGRLWQADPEAGVLVFSDHGFGGASTKAVFLNRFLEQQGEFRFAAQGAGQGSLGGRLRLASRLTMSRLKDIGLHYIPERVRTPLLRSMKLGNKIESSIRFGGIDWRQTVAYSDESPYFPAIWINVKGREEGGIVPPEQYREVRARVADKLRAWRDPENGQLLVRQVYNREEIYQGEQVERAPDLLIDWNLDHGYSYLSGRSLEDASRLPLRRLRLEEFNNHEMATRSGSHRPNGMLMAAGGPFGSGATLQGATLRDLAPTVLFCQGLPIPAEMEGQPLTALFKPDFLGANSPQRLAEGEYQAAHPLGEEPADNYSDEEREIIERRLRDLGYL